MPIIKSAKKRVKVARKATLRNAKTKRSLKSAVKAFQKTLESDKNKASATFNKAQSELGKAAKKHVMHKNKVARKQRQLARAAKAAGVKMEAAAKKAAVKAASKASKPRASAKSPAKKPVSKK